MQENYEFRKELMQWHRPGLRNTEYVPEADAVCLDGPWAIVIPTDAGEVLTTAAQDFQDYLFTSMDCSAVLRRGKAGGVGTKAGRRSKN